jgi:hypothetical protein
VVGSATEKRSFEFFYTVAAPSLESDGMSNFWTEIIPMFCHAHSSLRHAVLALSSFYESLIYEGSGLDVKLDTKQTFALRQYNKAMFQLRKHLIDTHDQQPLTLLIICVLFACLEYLQMKTVSSITHIQQGRKLLDNLASSGTVPDAQLEIVRKHIVPLYVRSGVATSSSGVYPWPIPMELNVYAAIPLAFMSMEQAAHTLYAIIDDVMCWRMLHKISTQDNPQAPTDFAYIATQKDGVRPAVKDSAVLQAELKSILSRLSRWNAIFNVYLASNMDDGRPALFKTLLQIHYHTILIWASTALAIDDQAYDACIESFSVIPPLCRTYLDSLRSRPGTSTKPQGSRGVTESKASRATWCTFETS